MGGPDKSVHSDRDRNGSEPHSICSIEGHSTVDVKTGELLWEPEERKEEEPYTCARSCGCPTPFDGHNITLKSVLHWITSNRVEWLAGITTGLTAVPTAVAFAILAGVQPSVGLRGTWIIMLVMALFGGRTGMVYSNSGSMGVIIEPFVADEGTEMVFYAFMLAGIIQVALGFLGVAKLLRLMPVSVIIGFVNGLAIVLFLAQMKSFQEGLSLGGSGGDDDEGDDSRRRLNSFSVFTDGSEWLSGSQLWYTLLIVVVTMITIVVYPMLTKNLKGTWAVLKMLPPILVGIIVATAVEWVIVRFAAGHDGTRTLEDIANDVGSFPQPAWFDDEFDMPPLNGSTFATILPTAISLMAVGLVESLMTVRLVNEITQTSSNIHREAIVGGVGNFVAGVFGGQGGNSEIGLTMVNVECGGRTRIAATVSGLLVLFVVLGASPAINLIPLAGLVGVMLVIAFNTFDWGSTLMVLAAALPERYRSHKAVFEKKISRADALIIVVVTVATPFTNLAIAVGIGIAVACLAFVWKNSEAVTAQSYFRAGYDVKDPAIIKVYEIMGNLFFASSETFLNLFDHRNDPPMVEVHLHTADIEDFSAMKTLETLGERYANAGKRLRLRRIKKESLRVLTKAQALMSDDMDVVMDEDPLVPQVSRHPKGVGEALIINFFDRDPYTRRHRSRSMAEVAYPSPDDAVVATAVTNGGGVLSTASGDYDHGGGVPRLTSAEV
ncbi:putative sulfate permease family protein [Ectocarpus siliculosus]|uniref:Sulfate permease family protein n=1 Tax=Ectocarpus siliculosus TaxID=2880 RepID=D8LK49_ECTSI|nr:putative sulfate permease family protein [Ectocarpus siliculosus]|eukprot:CBN74518.1 putative sulfate permease family protein [Ectocarpus siliculosus]